MRRDPGDRQRKNRFASSAAWPFTTRIWRTDWADCGLCESDREWKKYTDFGNYLFHFGDLWGKRSLASGRYRSPGCRIGG